MPESRPRRRPAGGRSRSRRLRRSLALAAVALVAFLYYRPLQSYLETRAALVEREAEVRALVERKRSLERRLTAQASAATLVREARRLGYVKPGERLFIVKGIDAWRHAHRRSRASGSGEARDAPR